MIQQTKILLFIFIITVISCNVDKENRNPDLLEPLDIEIPQELADNTEAVEFIRSSENAINELSDNIEELVIGGKDILSRNAEDLEALDKMKLGKMTVQFVSNSTLMANELEKMQKYTESSRSKGLNEAQIIAFKSVEKAIENRMVLISTKYQKYFNDN
ncbi:MAG: hypothetical protein ABFR05_01510 [Bacteroidota bacterium]